MQLRASISAVMVLFRAHAFARRREYEDYFPNDDIAAASDRRESTRSWLSEVAIRQRSASRRSRGHVTESHVAARVAGVTTFRRRLAGTLPELLVSTVGVRAQADINASQSGREVASATIRNERDDFYRHSRIYL